MVNLEEKIIIHGPCCDLQTRNLILQVASPEPIDEEKASERFDYLSSSLDDLNGRKNENKSPEEITNNLKELLEQKGPAFVHTAEYYKIIENEQERMKAYRALVVSSDVPTKEEAEIIENPLKFLHLPEDANFGQIRAAKIRLSKAWFPDLMFPENKDQYRRIFNQNKSPIEGKDYESWVKEITNLSPPKTLKANELETLSPNEQNEYRQQKEAYHKKEEEYKKVKSEMQLIATEKMKIINRAYEEAIKQFSEDELKSFAGFVWEKVTKTSKHFNSLIGEKSLKLDYEVLYLEGEGQVCKGGSERNQNPSPYLAFDFGEVYLEDCDYRQRLDLITFFAWTELVQLGELSPTLLKNITPEYELSENQTEQLRLMMSNREKAEFILDSLQIHTNQHEMISFITEAYEGPTFIHDIMGRDFEYFPLGVEFTQDDRLILKYKSQINSYAWGAEDSNAHFTPTDLQIMRVIAYGPLLE